MQHRRVRRPSAIWRPGEVLASCASPGPPAPCRASEMPGELAGTATRSRSARGQRRRPCRAPTRARRRGRCASTRCGHAVDLRGDDRVGDGRAEVELLHRVGHRLESAVSRKRVPIAIAVGAVRERGDEAAAVEEAAGRDHGDRRPRRPPAAAAAWSAPSRCGRRPRRPARSPRRRPTPRPSRRGAWRRSTARRRTPRVLQRLDRASSLGRLGEATPPARRSSIEQRRRGRRCRLRRRAGSRRTGWSVRSFTSRDRAAQLVGGHRRRWRGCRAPPAARGRRRRAAAPATQPMPVCTIGYVDAEQVADARVQTRRASASGTSWSPQAVRVDDLADQPQLLVGRQRGVSGTSPSIDELEAGGRDDLVDGDARVHRAQPHAVVGRLEVEHAEVGDDAAELVEARAPGRRARRRGRSRRRSRRRPARHEHAWSSGSGSSSASCR